MIDIPSCKWCKDDICVNKDCPMCADYCPVPVIEGVCRHEEREQKMTPMEAWANISRRLKQYVEEHAYVPEDIEAEVLVFSILEDMEKDGRE